jgi:hypothetical protein
LFIETWSWITYSSTIKTWLNLLILAFPVDVLKARNWLAHAVLLSLCALISSKGRQEDTMDKPLTFGLLVSFFLFLLQVSFLSKLSLKLI